MNTHRDYWVVEMGTDFFLELNIKKEKKKENLKWSRKHV